MTLLFYRPWLGQPLSSLRPLQASFTETSQRRRTSHSQAAASTRGSWVASALPSSGGAPA